MYDSFGNPIHSDDELNEPTADLNKTSAEASSGNFGEPTQPNTTYHYVYQPEQRETYRADSGSTAEPWTTSAGAAGTGTVPPENTGVKPRKAKAKKAHRSGMTAGRVVALLLACALIGCGSGVGGALLISRNTQTASVSGTASTESTIYEGERESTVLNVADIDTSKEMTASEVYAANVNSTVGITTSITTNYFGYTSTAAASGSGFIITSDGYIVTNYHVIEDSSSITVTLYDGTSYSAAVVGYDESNDLAVLKVSATGLTPVVLGDSDNLNVGDSVVAIGNPLGELTFSLTAGAVSALDREITMSNNVTMNLIQTDCAINSGNSGGALFNMYGEVIGITNAKYSSSSSSSTASIDNIGFAIPINSVKEIINNIIEGGYETKPYIGVTITSVSDEMTNYGLPAGAAIQSVTASSPAEEAGLQENDIITAINGQAITSSQEAVDLIGACSTGDKLVLSIYRSGETMEITVTVGETAKSVLDSSSDSTTTEQSQDSQSSQDSQNSEGGQSFSFPFGFSFGSGSNGSSSNGGSYGYGG